MSVIFLFWYCYFKVSELLLRGEFLFYSLHSSASVCVSLMICSFFESSGSSFVFIVLFCFLVDRCWYVVEPGSAALGQELRC